MRATLAALLMAFVAVPAFAAPGGDLGQDTFVEHAKGDDLPVLVVVNFESRKADLTPKARAILRELMKKLAADPAQKLELAGHADSTGAESFNQVLSEKRAHAVGHYLVVHGFDVTRLTVIGYGAFVPAADNATEAGRAKNRRVEVKISR